MFHFAADYERGGCACPNDTHTVDRVRGKKLTEAFRLALHGHSAHTDAKSDRRSHGSTITLSNYLSILILRYLCRRREIVKSVSILADTVEICGNSRILNKSEDRN